MLRGFFFGLSIVLFCPDFAFGDPHDSERTRTREMHEVTAEIEFECVPSEGGFRPRSLKTSPTGQKYKALGAYPMQNEQDCRKAVQASKHGVVCSFTGIGWKPTHFSGKTKLRPDHGYYGTSIKTLDLCLKTTKYSTPNEVCHWNDGNWIISSIDSSTQSHGNFASIDSCLKHLKQVPPFRSEGAGQSQAVEAKPHTDTYMKYCLACHNDDKVKAFPEWLLDSNLLDQGLHSPDQKLKSFAENWADKLYKHLVENTNMPPKEGKYAELHLESLQDPTLIKLKAYLTQRKAAESSAPTPLATNSVQILSEEYLNSYRQMLPKVNDSRLQAVLNDPNTIYYDEFTLPAAYQDASSTVIGFRNTNNGTFVDGAPFRDPKTGKLKVFSHGVGIDPYGKTKVFNFLSLPKDKDGNLKKIDVWIEKQNGPYEDSPLWKWRFPVGTVSGEILYQTASDGKSKVLEVRTRKKDYEGSLGDADAYVPFPSRTDLIEKLQAAKTSKPELGEEITRVLKELETMKTKPVEISARGYRVPGIAHSGLAEELPTMSEALTRELLSSPFKSSRGMVWATKDGKEINAPTTSQNFGIVPMNSVRGAITVDSKSCTSCHDKANIPISDLYGNWNNTDPKLENLIRRTTLGYGSTPGNDGNLRWHPFDPKLQNRFSQMKDNRRIRDAFKPIIEFRTSGK